MKSFITPQDLVDAISESTYIALFDDTNSGNRAVVDGSPPVMSVIARAHAQVMSYIPRLYKTMPAETAAGLLAADNIPLLLKDAELKWATIYAYRRHKEYVRTYSAEPGGSLVKEVDEMLKRLAESSQRIPPNDNPPETAPHNVGGGVEPVDPLNPPTRFTNFGDY